jgi:hypothetical protein
LIYILTFLSVSGNNVDKLICFTDREVYASGDRIRVSLFIPGESQSKIVYVDLSSFTGNHISGAKLLIENHRAEGLLTIPDSVRTGTYLLRSFVNYDHRKEFYIRDLLIANRFEDFSSGIKIQMQTLVNRERSGGGGLNISVPETIKRREKAQLKLTLDPVLLDQLDGGLDVCISKHISQFQSKEKYFIQESDGKVTVNNENKGILISGKVIDKESQLPVSNATVFLSVPDSIPGFQYDFTKSDGSFNFLLMDISGTVPMVIQAIKKEGENEHLKLVLDDKFNLNMPDLQPEILKSDNDLSEQLASTIESFTFQKIFTDEVLANRRWPHNYKTNLLFYGEPTYVVIPDQFYNLRSFAEISKELLTEVKFREKNGKLFLNLIDRETSLSFEEQAFVLVDGIPVQDLNVLSDMGTTRIGWIHTVLESRFYGDLFFPGVLAIYTKDSDLKWLKESDRMIKLEYEALQIKEPEVQPEIVRKIPDMRPLLFWETDVQPNSTMQFDFTGSDNKGTFKVRVIGKKKNGELVESEQIFTVN